MRSLFFVITLFILHACFAKNNETVVYSLDLSPEETWYNDRYDDVFDCAFLCLFNNGMCTIELYSYLTDDQVYYSTLFIGGYRWKNRTLRIEDNVNNYKFDLKKRRGRLKVISGFPFMIDRYFTNPESNQFGSPDTSDFQKKTILSEIDDKISHNQPYYPLEYRLYACRDLVKYSIDIKEDSTYSIVHGGLLLSEGIWERKGNKLYMYDEFLNCQYYAIIGDNELETYSINADGIRLKLK